MSINHGVNPTGSSYAYALLPGKTAAQTASYAASPGFTVLANTPTIQAVKQTQLNVVGANFWTDGAGWLQVGGSNFLTSDKKSSVMTQETSSGLDVSLSDPTHANTGTIQMEINRSAFGILSHDSRITVTQLSPTIKFTANVAGAAGTPLEISFGYASGAPMDTNLALDTTTTASSSYTGNSAWGTGKSVDGDRESLPTSMGWSSNNTLTANHSEWLQDDLGTTTSINGVDLYPMRFGNENSFPLDLQIDVSTNGTSWTTVASRTGVAIPGSSGLHLGFAAVNARYVRVTGTSLRPNPYDGNRYRMQLAEMEVHSTDVALGATVTASSSYTGSGWGVAKATDGSRASAPPSYGWRSNSTLTANHSEWVTVDLGSSVPIAALDLTPVIVNGGYGFPAGFTVETSNNGTSWSPALNQTGYALPTTTQHFTFPAVTARYLRITGTDLRANPNDSGLYRMQFAEIEGH